MVFPTWHNFLRWGGRVYSIDEECSGRPINFVTELRKTRAAIVHKWIVDRHDVLQAAMGPDSERLVTVQTDAASLFITK